MRTCAVAAFLPSTHGFSFPNAWPPGPTMRLGPVDTRMIGVGDASTGLCGGMVLTVRDLFEAGLAAWDRPQPANGSGPFRSIVRRQVQSLDWLRVPLRYFDLMAFRPDPPTGLPAMLGREPARVEAMEREWRHIRAVLEGGHLCPIGLLRTTSGSPWDLTRNHQVLGFGYSA